VEKEDYTGLMISMWLILFIVFWIIIGGNAIAQDKSLVNTSQSPFTALKSINMSYVMTAVCLHYRLGCNDSFLKIAIKVTDFLHRFFKRSPAELPQNAFYPSHYTDIIEMYRTIRDSVCLELAGGLVAARSPVDNGTDVNQDQIPFNNQDNTIGTITEISKYMYSASEKGLWVNLYRSNRLKTKLSNRSAFKLSQQINYPWDGNISIMIEECPTKAFSIFLRIPAWGENAEIKIIGQKKNLTATDPMLCLGKPREMRYERIVAGK
jgi:DUF1680 family protein